MQNVCGRIGGMLGILIFILPSAARSQDEGLARKSASTQERVVLALEHSLLQARVSTDISAHTAGFSDDGTYMHSSGRLQDKAEVLKMVVGSPWVSWSKSEEEVRLYGDLAVTHSLLSVRLTDKRTETVRTTGVYISRSGKWRQVSWQSSEGRFSGSQDRANSGK
ncbi:nuclear transport factor 2 family protein [Sphingomonas sp. BIUV-7]|uniref:Nuclear transport factor 2 family protein n=1 Tax=Sphingomonas natans TaxID=3063330 RepID=A0ABT8YA97_9SPHN|nr:nuclear transport factor 2 family protein [Sphingomonas sp. BIUV-7]